MSAPSRYPGGAAAIEALSDALEQVEIDRFPWRESIGASDPWRTLVAEFLLQRTRAEQVEPVYLAILRRWPTPERLARAPLGVLCDVLRPLGLHNVRAPRLLRVARAVAAGTAPIDLPNLGESSPLGIGVYTHRALASFAYRAAVGIVDVNVVRVISRAFGLRRASPERIGAMADHLARGDGSTAWRNYALLDVGRTYCRVKPRCGECPIRGACRTGRKANP